MTPVICINVSKVGRVRLKTLKGQGLQNVRTIKAQRDFSVCGLRLLYDWTYPWRIRNGSTRIYASEQVAEGTKSVNL